MTTKKNALYYIETIRTVLASLCTDRYVGCLKKHPVGKTTLYEVGPAHFDTWEQKLRTMIEDQLTKEANVDGVSIERVCMAEEFMYMISDSKNKYDIKISFTKLHGTGIVGVVAWKI